LRQNEKGRIFTMKKKVLAAALAGVMVLAMAAGCAKPKVTLGQYKGLELTDISAKEVEDEMAAILESHATLVEVDRAAVEGDTVNINYVGTLDGVAFEGGTDDSEEGTDLELGSNSFIDGFEEGLIGATAGQKLDLNLTFPDPYENNPDLAGKAVVFSVTVNKVQETQIPELTDAFVVENYPQYGSTTEELTKALHDEMQKDTFYNQITKLIMESSTVEKMPADEIAEEALLMVRQYTSYAEYYASMYGIDTEMALYYFMGFESTEALQQYAQEYATSVIKNELILREIAKIEGIELTKDIYAEKAAEYAKSYGYETVEEFEEVYKKEEIETVILMNLVMDFIIDEATIIAPTEE